MLCDHCGARLPDNSRFCPECGHALTARPAAPQIEGGVRLRVGRPTSSAPGYGGQEPSRPAAQKRPDAPVPQEPPVSAENNRIGAPAASAEPVRAAPALHDAGKTASEPFAERTVGFAPSRPSVSEPEEPTIPFAAVRPAPQEKAAAPDVRHHAPAAASRTPDDAPAAPDEAYDPPEDAEDADMKTFAPKKPSRARVWTAPSTAASGGLSGVVPPAAQPDRAQPAPEPPVRTSPAPQPAPSAPRPQNAGQKKNEPAAPVRPKPVPAQPQRPAAKSARDVHAAQRAAQTQPSASDPSDRRRLLTIAGIAAGVALLLAICLLLVSKCGGSAVIRGETSSSTGSSQPDSRPSEPSVPAGPSVPDVLGRSAADAAQLLRDAGYEVAEEERYDGNVEAGLVGGDADGGDGRAALPRRSPPRLPRCGRGRSPA